MDPRLEFLDSSPEQATDNTDSKWVAWALWAAIALAMVMFAVLCLGIDTGLLLGWAVGVIVAATLTLFGRT